jgi:cytochrome c peroxidase
MTFRIPKCSTFIAAIMMAGCLVPVMALAGTASSPQKEILTRYAAETGGIAALSAERGREFFMARPASGKSETPSCTSCHTNSPFKAGQTRAGKTIAPMALSKTSDRYANPKKIEKWFRRNCKSVLGRICSAREKGDFILFMTSQ